MAEPQLPVVIIGAGFSGIVSLKICIENGLNAICLEKTDSIGGLWRFREDDQYGLPSVQRSTVINTSKELIAFSDFPPPKEYDNFMHNSMNLAYLESYAHHNNLKPHIRFQHEILKVEKNSNYEATGQWRIKFKDAVTNVESELIASGIMVCSGHHTFPNQPKLPDQSKFQGQIMHTHSYKDSKGLEGKRVMVVGIGNSAVDAAIESSHVAKTVYLSTHRGAWITRCMSEGGLPFDFHITRYNAFLEKYLNRYYLKKAEKQCNSVFDHTLFNLKPDHRYNQQHVTISDDLPGRIIRGYIKVKRDVARLTKKGVIFKGEENKGEIEVDTIIMATGYDIKFPIAENILKTDENNVDLYLRVFPPEFKHSTLAFIGIVQAIVSSFTISEMQARWFALLMKGNRKLPPIKDRLQEIHDYKSYIKARYVNSPRHTVEVDYLPYMDEIAKQVGCKPNMIKYFLTDQKLFWTLLHGPSVSYQYRLSGPKSWEGARDAVLMATSRMTFPLNSMHPMNKMPAGITCSNYTPNYWLLLSIMLALFAFCLCL